MIVVTCREMSQGGTRQRHIVRVGWINTTDGETGTSTVQAMVDFIDGGGKAVSHDPQVSIHVVREPGHAWIETNADNTTANNLLRLPACR